MTTDVPAAPTGSSTAAKRLWASVQEQYVLEEHEQQLLVQACRTVTLLDRLDAEMRRDGTMLESSQGSRVHPAASEARQQSIALARLLAAAEVAHWGRR